MKALVINLTGAFILVIYTSQQGDICMSETKPIIDTSWELKWKRSLRRRLINCLARIENDGRPTQELGYELAKAKECYVYWNSDTAMWEKHQMVIETKDEKEYAELDT